MEDLRAQLRLIVVRACEAASDPATPVNMMPQLLGGATRALAELRRSGPSPTPLPWKPDPIHGHPELPPLLPIMPGPPWDPLRGVPEDKRNELDDELRARGAIWHRERADELQAGMWDLEVLLKVAAQLADARQ